MMGKDLERGQGPSQTFIGILMAFRHSCGGRLRTVI